MEREESSVATGTSVDSTSTTADNGGGGGTPEPDSKGSKEEPRKDATAKLTDEPSQASNSSSMASGGNTKLGSALKKGFFRGNGNSNCEVTRLLGGKGRPSPVGWRSKMEKLSLDAVGDREKRR